MKRLPHHWLAAALGVALIASTAFAAKGGNGNGGGKPGGGDDGGSGDGPDVCAGIGFDLDSNGSIDTSRTLGSDGTYNNGEYRFVYAGEIASPTPVESARWGSKIDAWKGAGDDVFLAVGSWGVTTIDVLKVNASDPPDWTVVDSIAPPAGVDIQFSRGALEDVDNNSSPDLILVSDVGATAWIFLSLGYPDGAPVFSAQPDITLKMDVSGDFTSTVTLGRKGIVYDASSDQLFLADRSATAGSGPNGAVFQCDLTQIGLQDPITCPPLPAPTNLNLAGSYGGLANSIALGDADGDGAVDLLVDSNGGGKGKNKFPDRVLVYDIAGGQWTGALVGKGGNVNAFDYYGGGTDEVFATEFHSPGWVYADPDLSGDGLDVYGDSAADFQLQLNPDLVHQYSNRTAAGTLPGGEQLLVLGGAGVPEGCPSVANDGYVYFYLFPDATLTPIVDTLQAPDGAGEDFGWDVATTGTNLVVIGERVATVGGVDNVGKLYFYRYVGAQAPPAN